MVLAYSFIVFFSSSSINSPNWINAVSVSVHKISAREACSYNLFFLVGFLVPVTFLDHFSTSHRSSQLQLLVLPRYLVSVVFQILWIWCLVCCTDVYNTIGIYFKGHGNLWVPFGPCGIFESLNWPICLLSLTNVLSP